MLRSGCGLVAGSRNAMVAQMVKELELAFGATLGGHSVRGVTLIHPGRLALIGGLSD